MLVQVQVEVYQERKVVLHPQIDGILQGDNLQFLRIRIMIPADAVVQGQQSAFPPEQHLEYRVLIVAIRRRGRFVASWPASPAWLPEACQEAGEDEAQSGLLSGHHGLLDSKAGNAKDAFSFYGLAIDWNEG